MATMACEHCGVTFTVKPAEIRGGRRYCTKRCYTTAHAPVECMCQTCGKSFSRPPSQASRGEGDYCSTACSGVARRGVVGEGVGRWRGGQLARVCQNCGKTFYVDPNRVKAGRGKHCSRECYWARVRGEVHWKYRHGRGRAPYTGGFTPRIRRLVIERDKVCVDCGEWDDRPRRMQIHHLDGGHDNHAVDNLVLLCLDCHVKRHHGRSSAVGIGSNSSGQS